MKKALFLKVSCFLSLLLLFFIPNAQAAVGDYLFTFQGSPLTAPHGVAVDPYTMDILVADTGGDRVVIYNQEGFEILSIPMPPPPPEGGFGDGPRGVGANSLHEIIVADTPNNRILVFNYSGTLLRSWGSWGASRAN